MPKMDGVATTARIRELYPDLRTVVLTSLRRDGSGARGAGRGGLGYLLKDAEPTEVVAAIRAAARGEVFLDPQWPGS